MCLYRAPARKLYLNPARESTIIMTFSFCWPVKADREGSYGSLHPLSLLKRDYYCPLRGHGQSVSSMWLYRPETWSQVQTRTLKKQRWRTSQCVIPFGCIHRCQFGCPVFETESGVSSQLSPPTNKQTNKHKLTKGQVN